MTRRTGNRWPAGAIVASAAVVVAVTTAPDPAPPPPRPDGPPESAAPDRPATPEEGVVPPAVGSGVPFPGSGIGTPGQILPVAYGNAIPAIVLAAYQRAAARVPGCHLPVALLAAIGKVETGHARGGQLTPDGTTVSPILGPVLNGTGGLAAISDTDGGRYDDDPTWDRAVGPMQFIPGTWARWAADGNGDSRADPHNVHDASFAAAGYLCAGGRDLATDDGVRASILSYNNSTSYLNLVLSWFGYYRSGVVAGPAPYFPGDSTIPEVGGTDGTPYVPPPQEEPPTTPPPTTPPPAEETPEPPEPPPPQENPGLVTGLVCTVVEGVGGLVGGLLGAPPPPAEPGCP